MWEEKGLELRPSSPSLPPPNPPKTSKKRGARHLPFLLRVVLEKREPGWTVQSESQPVPPPLSSQQAPCRPAALGHLGGGSGDTMRHDHAHGPRVMGPCCVHTGCCCGRVACTPSCLQVVGYCAGVPCPAASCAPFITQLPRASWVCREYSVSVSLVLRAPERAPASHSLRLSRGRGSEPQVSLSTACLGSACAHPPCPALTDKLSISG